MFKLAPFEKNCTNTGIAHIPFSVFHTLLDCTKQANYTHTHIVAAD